MEKRILSGHEIGQPEIEMMRTWQKSLEKICANTNRAGMTMIHFKIELRRVNRWLKQLNP